MTGRKPKLKAAPDVELVPDGWDRFTSAVKRMAPLKPKRAKTKPRKSAKSA